jgi:acyl-coenzyme A synthetase/AMP-(fatty) acid ligase
MISDRHLTKARLDVAQPAAVVADIVVLRDGHTPSDELARALQDHVKDSTAPTNKYPRIVEFADDLPKTSSGKVRRALLRGEEPRRSSGTLRSDPNASRGQAAAARATS